jgi:cation-transporting ATPase 13A1
VQAGTLKETERMDEDDPLKQFTMMWSQPFMPNLMNTTVFLVETAQIVAVFIVNYKGRPFMRGIMENHVLFMSLFTTVFGVAFCAWEVLPQFNHAVHFHPFPSDEYRFRVLALIAQSLLGTFLFDRLALRVFAPEVFWAVWEEAVHTHWTDLLPIFWTLLRAVVGFGLLATGNPVIWAGAWYFNKKFMEWYTDMEEKRIKQMEAREAGRRNNNGSAA